MPKRTRVKFSRRLDIGIRVANGDPDRERLLDKKLNSIIVVVIPVTWLQIRIVFTCGMCITGRLYLTKKSFFH